MNYKMMGKLMAQILLVEGFFMIPALLICIFEKDGAGTIGFLVAMAAIVVVAAVMLFFCKNAKKRFYAREGLVTVGVCWILLSVFGCIPFLASGEIPSFVDALFEMASGFTTTGASVVTDVEFLTKGILYWRSFSQWLGGMGVLVFLLAIVPASGDAGFTMHILRAESPGPNVGKLVPKMRQTAMILYLIYIVMTIACFLFLIVGRVPLFDAVCATFETAGTGGFGIKNNSMAGYSYYAQNVCTVFMILFGVNFSCYYMLLLGHVREVLKDEELRLYLGIILTSIVLITINCREYYTSLRETLHHVSFQVASIITTTGFVTTDYDVWPSFSKAILLFLMTIGASAGSTGGGFKCGRAMLLFKNLRRNIRQTLHPQKVQVVRNNGQMVSERVLDNTNAYLAAYVTLVILSFIIVSLDEMSPMTNLSAVLSCVNNIGPGVEGVGPVGNYAGFGILSKLTLTVDMWAGRLEIFPILILFSKSTWKNR